MFKNFFSTGIQVSRIFANILFSPETIGLQVRHNVSAAKMIIKATATAFSAWRENKYAIGCSLQL
jgi:hypothetical protein